jgi:hypothetical protein
MFFWNKGWALKRISCNIIAGKNIQNSQKGIDNNIVLIIAIIE